MSLIGLSEGLGAPLSRLGHDSAPLPGPGQTSLQGWPSSSFENPTQASLCPAGFPDQTGPTSALQMNKAAAEVGTTPWTLQGGLTLLVAAGLSPLLITVRCPGVKSFRFPCSPCGAQPGSGSQEGTHSGSWVCALGSLFCWGAPGWGQALRLLPHQPGEGAVQSACSSSSQHF